MDCGIPGLGKVHCLPLIQSIMHPAASLSKSFRTICPRVGEAACFLVRISVWLGSVIDGVAFELCCSSGKQKNCVWGPKRRGIPGRIMQFPLQHFPSQLISYGLQQAASLGLEPSLGNTHRMPSEQNRGQTVESELRLLTFGSKALTEANMLERRISISVNAILNVHIGDIEAVEQGKSQGVIEQEEEVPLVFCPRRNTLDIQQQCIFTTSYF